MKKVLVTGSAGFIGSNFVPFLLSKEPDAYVVSFDKLTAAGDLQNLQEVSSHSRHLFVQGDICDRKKIETLFKDYEFDSVFHFAAESHVDYSIENPEAFMQTNIQGTFTLLDVAREFWLKKPFEAKKNFEKTRFHHISTDEVFGSLGAEGSFSESTPYAPNNPYSASKAASDMIARSYNQTFGLDVLRTNSSNNYGPKQNKEKLIPTVIRKALAKAMIPLYGDGKNIRDWIYVQDHCEALWLTHQKAYKGDYFNIGGKTERTNLEVAQEICRILDELRPRSDGRSYSEQIGFIEDRPGHDTRYAIDATKIETKVGFKPKESFESGLRKTILWYLDRF